MIRAAVAFGWILGLAAGAGAQQPLAKTPPTVPIHRIEAGAHVSPVTGIAADAAGRYLVTASDDKSARVWESPSLHLVRVLRPPLGLTPDEGKLYAVALSPDGALVAAGGWTGREWDGTDCVYVFYRASGQIVPRLVIARRARA